MAEPIVQLYPEMLEYISKVAAALKDIDENHTSPHAKTYVSRVEFEIEGEPLGYVLTPAESDLDYVLNPTSPHTSPDMNTSFPPQDIAKDNS